MFIMLSLLSIYYHYIPSMVYHCINTVTIIDIITIIILITCLQRDAGASEQIIKVERLELPPPEERRRPAVLLDVMEISYVAQLQGGDKIVDSSKERTSGLCMCLCVRWHSFIGCLFSFSLYFFSASLHFHFFLYFILFSYFFQFFLFFSFLFSLYRVHLRQYILCSGSAKRTPRENPPRLGEWYMRECVCVSRWRKVGRRKDRRKWKRRMFLLFIYLFLHLLNGIDFYEYEHTALIWFSWSYINFKNKYK